MCGGRVDEKAALPIVASECCDVPNINKKKNIYASSFGGHRGSPGVTRGRPARAGDARRRIAITLGYILPDLQLMFSLYTVCACLCACVFPTNAVHMHAGSSARRPRTVRVC